MWHEKVVKVGSLDEGPAELLSRDYFRTILRNHDIRYDVLWTDCHICFDLLPYQSC